MRLPTVLVATSLTAAALALSWSAGTQSAGTLGAVPAATAPAVPGSSRTTAPLRGGGLTPSSPSIAKPGTSKATSPSSAQPPATTAPAAAPHTVDGQVAMTDYGPVQVRVSLVGTHIQDVVALQLTDSSGRSVRISASAEPILRQEAVAAQSSQIDTVSGATYTSDGYRQSLQSALDAAHA